ncbi:MAG: 3-hydroxyacyl-CoA dehydrogenase NAD-binding domain-containing protein [Rhodospirillaceae bacterium]|nr:3-hydroxyacyl-CoA dehydrogenase NAD-binding domain-containing protein [Rhodospirillaceae bacterium]
MKIQRDQFSGMTPAIDRAAVIGAGSMGAGIAAQFASAGIPVLLLDIPGQDGQRNGPAEAGLQRQLKTGGFMHPAAAECITIGNTEDDLALLADADWIVEAIVEKPDIKQALYARIETVRKDGSVVSSNTSTLPRARLVSGLPPRFDRDFVITHFFNPPRQMQLVEIISGPGTAPATTAKATLAAENVLGKTPVMARDTPGFIANRIGCHWLAVGVIEAFRQGLTPEEADAAAGRPFTVPGTGVFGLMDLVGIDLVPTVWGGLEAMLPPTDELNVYRLSQDPALAAMVAAGLHGRKTKAGFYRTQNGVRETYDPASQTFRPFRPADPAGNDLKALCETPGKAGAYAWTVLSEVILYASTVAPEIAGDIAAIDTAMRLGYNWGKGPFALADSVGVAWIAQRLASEGRAIPPLLARAAALGGFYTQDGYLSTTGEAIRPDLKAGMVSLPSRAAGAAALLSTPSASLWDIGDGVACLELHAKRAVLDPSVFDALDRTIAQIPTHFQALVIGSEDPRAFSTGTDPNLLAALIDSGDFAALEATLRCAQDSLFALKRSPFPVVAAAFGQTLDGGCELILHCDAIVAHAELAAGMPGVKSGLLPAWGGCAQSLLRSGSGALPPEALQRLFAGLLSGQISGSAHWARDMGILAPGDTITMNRAHLLADAKARAIVLAKAGYRPPMPASLSVAGQAGAAILMDWANAQPDGTNTDKTIAAHLATVLTGGNAEKGASVSEDAIRTLEREAFLGLVRLPEIQARIAHLAKTGKALKN